jgi:hypothetical protein
MKFTVRLSPITVEVSAPELPITFGPVRERSLPPTEEALMASVQLTDVQEARATIAPQDRAGNPASVDGVPTWESSDTSVITVSPTEDGLTADVVTTGTLGTATVTVTADADLGEGVTSLTGTLEVEVIASQAADLNVSVGTPTERA